ncbi:hypothetical protein Nepgr_005138 [Nepenthes gracilis]|uniref:Pentatricopeptide repeat-containing protein n=1 Tax=Nepenthes gracilis TaxID=150966 RepID=A0AAD3XFY9_NEPGR|nr:hypothetical protein Nepgr_005138 [Nepenthes gracilis]
MESAMRVFENMCETGISPNMKTYETLIWGYGEAKQPWKAEEQLQIMKDRRVFPKKSTIVLVAEAWRAIGLVNEAKRVMNMITEDKNFTALAKEDEKPAESLEKIYQNQNLGTDSKVLQIPGFVVKNQSGSAASANISRRMAQRGCRISARSLFRPTISMAFTHRCGYCNSDSDECTINFMGQAVSWQKGRCLYPIDAMVARVGIYRCRHR